jgi:hypothetical protein
MARQIDDLKVAITIEHSGGSDFTPFSKISGWEIIANGEQVPIQDVYRYDPKTIHIVTGRSFGRQAHVRYLYGAMPEVDRPVMDNTPLSLPLEEYQSEIH